MCQSQEGASERPGTCSSYSHTQQQTRGTGEQKRGPSTPGGSPNCPHPTPWTTVTDRSPGAVAYLFNPPPLQRVTGEGSHGPVRQLQAPLEVQLREVHAVVCNGHPAVVRDLVAALQVQARDAAGPRSKPSHARVVHEQVGPVQEAQVGSFGPHGSHISNLRCAQSHKNA